MRVIFLLLCSLGLACASGGGEHANAVDLSMTWVGILSLIVFLLGYFMIAAEEVFHINKAKPALFIGTFIFMLIGVYMLINGMDMKPLESGIHQLILEIAEIIFFLMVAMTYIETLIERDVFDALKYKLVSNGFTYKKLFWLTGLLAFFISPVADNLTTALILSTVLLTIEKDNKQFLVPGAINIVVAANAGGAWSPFGDITTLMAWAAHKGAFADFLYLFPASIIGWGITGYLLSLSLPKGKPAFDAENEPPVYIKEGGKGVIALGVFTIFSAVMGHQLFHLPAMWGMMFGLALLKIYSYTFKRKLKKQQKSPEGAFDVFLSMSKIENDTLMFFFGILAAVGGLHYLGFLEYAVALYHSLGATTVNIGVGFLSAIVDNVPVMSAVLKSNPQMGLDQWLLVTLTAGIGGSLISFGSAAGVGVMGKLRGIYTFGAHMRHAWTILVGYIASLVIWYLQFQIMGIY